MRPTEHIVLVPGFFGFTHLGQLPYFAHVEPLLLEAAAAAAQPVEISVVSTDPTASLPYRAARLAEHLRDLMEQGAERFHLVGHSTGGLDARLMVTPAVALPTNADVEACARRVRSVVSVATPHRGTPLASLFAGRFAQGLLQVFSLTSMVLLRRGRVPVMALLRLAGMLERVRAGRRPNPSAVARLHQQLLADFSPERQAQLESFLKQVQADQGLLPQLTPDGLEVFNASTPDRPGVRYGSAVSWGRPPGVGSAIKAGLDPYAQATHAVYTAIHNMSRGMAGRRADVRAPGTDGLLGAAYGVVPGWDATDGIVPTRSQVWGELLHATVADHLDVVGYFSDPQGDPPHFDWLASASGFNRERFEALWKDVAQFILDDRRALRSGAPALLASRAGGHAVPAPAEWPMSRGEPWSDGSPFADDRVVSPMAHRRWLLGRAVVWGLAVGAAVLFHQWAEDRYGWLASVAVALTAALIGEASYRRLVLVDTPEGPARNVSSFPARYIVWRSRRIVRLTSARPRALVPAASDPAGDVGTRTGD